MALVLSQREFESVVIYPYADGDDRQITVTIERIEGGQVRLSFEAPDEVDIWRDELVDRA